jgi:hypothetical protein
MNNLNTDKSMERKNLYSTAMQDMWHFVIANKREIDWKTYVVLRNKIQPLLEKDKADKIEAYLTAKQISDGILYSPLASIDIAEKWFFEKYGY